MPMWSADSDAERNREPCRDPLVCGRVPEPHDCDLSGAHPSFGWGMGISPARIWAEDRGRLLRRSWREDVMLVHEARATLFGARRRGVPLMLLALVAVLALALAGCSASSGGSGSPLSLGLAGATSDHQGQPPQIAASGPGGTYASVYNNQIWVHDDGKAGARQLTHLVL